MLPHSEVTGISRSELVLQESRNGPTYLLPDETVEVVEDTHNSSVSNPSDFECVDVRNLLIKSENPCNHMGFVHLHQNFVCGIATP